MIARFCKWYLRKYTNYMWELYNDGFMDGRWQTLQEGEE